MSRQMSPEKKKKLLIQAFFRFCLILGLIAGFFLYQSFKEGDFSSTSLKADSIKEKLKNIFLSSGGTAFDFPLLSVVEKNIRETGKITYASGKTSVLENNYKSREQQTFSNPVLSLKGKTDGEFDPVLKPLMKDGTYSQKIDLSASFCPEDFVPHYPSALRSYVYFMPRTPLFDGKTWEINSCGGKFLCSYSASTKEGKNKIDLGCSGSIGKTQTTISGTIKINEKFDGFAGVEMEITSENDDLTSIWNFYEEIFTLSKISKINK